MASDSPLQADARSPGGVSSAGISEGGVSGGSSDVTDPPVLYLPGRVGLLLVIAYLVLPLLIAWPLTGLSASAVGTWLVIAAVTLAAAWAMAWVVYLLVERSRRTAAWVFNGSVGLLLLAGGALLSSGYLRLKAVESPDVLNDRLVASMGDVAADDMDGFTRRALVNQIGGILAASRDPVTQQVAAQLQRLAAADREMQTRYREIYGVVIGKGFLDWEVIEADRDLIDTRLQEAARMAEAAAEMQDSLNNRPQEVDAALRELDGDHPVVRAAKKYTADRASLTSRAVAELLGGSIRVADASTGMLRLFADSGRWSGEEGRVVFDDPADAGRFDDLNRERVDAAVTVEHADRELTDAGL